MLLKYYKNPLLAYSNRQRYKTFPIDLETPIQETQKAVKLGDGSETTVTTKAENLCNYVTIDNTRWYVVSYVYENGGQVTMRLRRDVIGEFGLSGCVGKIERGYTNTILRNRKELSLNQLLKKRLPVIPDNNLRGNYTVSTPTNEKWGILYISKPSAGEEYQTIPIPQFAPQNYDSGLTFVDNGESRILSNNFSSSVSFIMGAYYRDVQFIVTINFYYNEINNSYTYDFSYRTTSNDNSLFAFGIQGRTDLTILDYEDIAVAYINAIANQIIYNKINNINESFTLPTGEQKQITLEQISLYNNNSAFYNGHYWSFSTSNQNINRNGTTGSANDFYTDIVSSLSGTLTVYLQDSEETVSFSPWTSRATDDWINEVSTNTVTQVNFTTTQIPDASAGILNLDLDQNFVDEPYVIFAIPLYDVTVTGPGVYTKTVNQSVAFEVFNTVIQYLSGENAYLVDAQIYPYGPNLREATSEVNHVPVFTVTQTSFERTCSVSLKPLVDVKKEYIKKEYSIVAPDQSGKFTFNFYDYTNNITEDPNNPELNNELLTIIIKTALKPFNIISSAVIIPDPDSIMGNTYSSDLRGCRAISSGFECSLSTNQFQQYVRNNINYQNFFDLEQEELQKKNAVELVNEKCSQVINTVTATFMGAVGGASMADIGIWNSAGAKAIGGITGAAVAAGTVGSQMEYQKQENEKLRRYEESLQQQRYDLQIGTIKNLPNQVSRISSFNEIIMRTFYYAIEVYECTDIESDIVDNFIEKYAYGLGIFGNYEDFIEYGWFVRGTLTVSNLIPILHGLLENELKGGIYYNE